MNYPIKPKPMPILALDDDLGSPVMKAIDQLAAEGNVLTRWRLQRLRSHEAIKLAQTSMVLAMEAKRHVFATAVEMAKDHAGKLLLAQNMDKSKAVDEEINSMIAQATADFMSFVTERELAAYLNELQRVAEAQALFDQGKLSQHRYEALIESIEKATDVVRNQVHEVTLEIMGNLIRRFKLAVQQHSGRV